MQNRGHVSTKLRPRDRELMLGVTGTFIFPAPHAEERAFGCEADRFEPRDPFGLKARHVHRDRCSCGLAAKALDYKVSRDAGILCYQGAELPVQIAGPPKAVSQQRITAFRSPGKIGSAVVKGSQKRAAICSENLMIASKGTCQITVPHRAYILRVWAEIVWHYRNTGADQFEFAGETEAAIKGHSKRSRVQTDAALAGQSIDSGLHQAGANTCPSIIRMHDHHRQPAITFAIAQEANCAAYGRVALRDPAAPVRRIQEESPVFFDLIPAAETTKIQTRRNVNSVHSPDSHAICG